MSHPRVRKNITLLVALRQARAPATSCAQNCIWPPTFEGAEGFTLLNNLYVEPAYVNAAAKDFRIVPGTPCAPLLDHPDVPGTGRCRHGDAVRRRSAQAVRRLRRSAGRQGPRGARHSAAAGVRCGSAGALRADRSRARQAAAVP